MADVIFNGTDGRKPDGMGEVSLTLGGVDAAKIFAQRASRSPTMKSRSRAGFSATAAANIFRTNPVPPKDIQQLFMGTGVGRTSYKVFCARPHHANSSSKPEDRRMIFEEAAASRNSNRKKRIAPQTRIHRAKSFARRRHDWRSERQTGSAATPWAKAKRYKLNLLNCNISKRNSRGISSIAVLA